MPVWRSMLQIQELQAGYGDHTVVSLPSFSLQSGDHCLISGSSGSGKTTLLYAIAGLLKPLTGHVLIYNTDITQLDNAAKDAFRGGKIGIICQSLHTVNALSVIENLLLAQFAAGLPQNAAKAEMLLARLGLLDYRNHKPTNLSHGQKQRLAIARATLNNPLLILGDEPTSALDDTNCDMVMQLLLDNAALSGASLILATHDARIQKYFTKTVKLGA